MSKCKTVSYLLLVAFFGALAVTASANANIEVPYSHPDAENLCGPNPVKDSRYITPYNPRFITTANKNLQFSKIDTYDQKIWVCMKTSLPEYKSNNGIGWVVSPAGSQIGINGNNAYYLGTSDGQFLRCYNRVYKIVVEQETFEVSTPAPKPTPVLAPTPLECGPNQHLSDNGKYCVETQVNFVQPCANDLAIKGKSRFVQDRIGGGFWKKLFSFGLSAAGTLIAGGDVGTAIKNGAIGVVIQTGQTMVNPSEGAITLTGAGLTKPVVLPKGKNYSWVYGDKSYQLVWKGDVATVFGSTEVAGQNFESACYSYNPKEASNLGVYVTGGSNQTYSTGANKIQTQTPIRPTVAPTNGYPVGTYGYCSRPVAGQSASLCQVGANGTVFIGYTGGSYNFPIFGN